MLNITSTSKINDNKKLKILLYGLAGKGKTALAATCQQPIFLNAEGGELTLKRKNLEKIYGKETKNINYEINVVDVSHDNIESVLSELNSQKYQENYKTIFLDSLSKICSQILFAESKKTRDPRRAYGQYQIRIESLMNLMQRMKYHVVCVAKAEQRTIKSGDNEIVNLIPAFKQQKVSYEMTHEFDFTWAVDQVDDSDQRKCVIYTQDYGPYHCKGRDSYLDLVERPHIAYLINKVLKG